MTERLMARLVFDSDSDLDLPAEELRKAGYEVHRMPMRDLLRYHLDDDHIEAVITGPSTTRSWMRSGVKSRTSPFATAVCASRSAPSKATTSHSSRRSACFGLLSYGRVIAVGNLESLKCSP